MKQSISLITVIVSMAVVSCSLPEQELTTLFQEGQPVQFSAYNGEDAPSTKTLLIQDGYLDNGQPQMITWWSAHDEIGIFYGASSVNRFVSNNTEPVKKAMFEGTLNAFTGQTESGDFNYFWAVYPYDSAVSCDGSSVTAVLAHNQVATIGTYAPNTNVTIAKSAGLSLAFYNTCSFFRFSVSKEGVKSVTFKGNNNEYVAGKFSISMGSDGKPTTPTIVEGKKEIILTAPNNGTFEVGEPYYFVLLPQTFTKGFTVTFQTLTETGNRIINANASFPRNQINFSNGEFDQSVTYNSKPQPDNEIWYKTLTNTPLKDIWISGAFGANFVSHTYENGKGIIEFDGAVTIIPEDFLCAPTDYSGADELRDITYLSIPNSVKSIGWQAFFGLIKLENFVREQYTSLHQKS